MSNAPLSLITNPFIVRNTTFGVEDSLISTTGLIVGIHAAGMAVPMVIATGLILIFVESISMAYVAFLSEESFLRVAKETFTIWQTIGYGITMLISYVSAGLVPLIPFFLRWDQPHYYSIAFAIIIMFMLIIWVQKDLIRALVLTLLGTGVMLMSILVGKQFTLSSV